MKTNSPETIISFKKGKVKVVYSVFSKEKQNGKQICVIPGLDLIFRANSDGEVIPRSAAMIKAFLNYYLREEKDFPSLARQLNKLGFKAPMHSLVMKQILNNNFKSSASFKSPDKLPENFEGAKIRENSLMEIDC